MEIPLIKPFKRPDPEDINTRVDEPDKETIALHLRHRIKYAENLARHANDFDALEDLK